MEDINLYKTYLMGDSIIYAPRNLNPPQWQHEIFAIVGPSGVNNSILMNMIGCLDKPASGTYIKRNFGVQDGEIIDDREVS